MHGEITIWGKLFWNAVTPGPSIMILFLSSGPVGMLIILIFALLYMLAIRDLAKRRTGSALQKVVMNVYLVATYHLHGINFVLGTLHYGDAACMQSAMFWLSSAELLLVSLVLLYALVPLVLIALLTKPEGLILRSPGGIPGAVMSLLGAIIVNIFFMATFFGQRYNSTIQEHIQEEARRHNRVTELRQKDRIAEPTHGTYSVTQRSPQRSC